MLNMKKLLLFTFFIISHYGLNGQVNITYIANEGVLIHSPDKKIIIDGLFDDFYEAYLSPDQALRQTMYNGQAPFDQIDLVLATHIHRDHFEAQIAGKFLSNHHESKLLSSQQIHEDLKENYVPFKSIEKQIIAHERVLYTVEEVVNGITVMTFFIHHSGGERTKSIENMGFIITLNGKRILHLGDSDMDIERFKSLDLKQYNIDIALVPYWYLSDDKGSQILSEWIKPAHLIGIHFPLVGSPMMLEEIAKNHPESKVFQKSLETISFN